MSLVRVAMHLYLVLGLTGPADTDGLALVREALVRAEGQKELGDEHVARRLSALGARAAPGLLALVEGSGLELVLGDEETPVLLLCAPDRVGEVALAALAGLPVEAVLAALRAELARSSGPETRALAFRVLAALRSAQGLALALELLPSAGLELASPSVRSHARNALSESLRHDARAFTTLAAQLAGLPEDTLPLVVEALAVTQDQAALDALENLLGRSPALDLAVIEAVARAGEYRPWRLAAEAAEVLERWTSAKEPARRAAATRALARLARTDSVPRLAARLDDPAPVVVAAAVHALQSCAGRADLAEPAAWKAWLARESAWWQDEGAARVEALRAGDPAATSAHLRELLAHPLAREVTADVLFERLDQLGPYEFGLTCSFLVRLGAEEAVPDLVPLLDAAEAPVRDAAWKALTALTGAELPPERSLWDAWAFE